MKSLVIALLAIPNLALAESDDLRCSKAHIRLVHVGSTDDNDCATYCADKRKEYMAMYNQYPDKCQKRGGVCLNDGYTVLGNILADCVCELSMLVMRMHRPGVDYLGVGDTNFNHEIDQRKEMDPCLPENVADRMSNWHFNMTSLWYDVHHVHCEHQINACWCSNFNKLVCSDDNHI